MSTSTSEDFVYLLQRGLYDQARAKLPDTSRDVADGVIALARAFGDKTPQGAVGLVCVHAVTNICIMHEEWKTERARRADEQFRHRGAPLRQRPSSPASSLRVSLFDLASSRS